VQFFFKKTNYLCAIKFPLYCFRSNRIKLEFFSHIFFNPIAILINLSYLSAMRNLVTRYTPYLFLIVFVLIGSCNGVDEQPTDIHQADPTSNYSGNLAHEWMHLTYSIVQENHLYGPHAARIYGYTGLAIYEAVYNGIPKARSMAGQINDYPHAPTINTLERYDWGVVLSTTMRTVLPELVDNLTTSQRSSIILLAEQQENEMLAEGTERETFDRSKDFGNQIGQAIITRIRKDGRDVIRNIVPQLPVRDAEHPWYWDRTTFGQEPVEPMWGTLRTFVLDNSQSCEVEPPLPYSTLSNSAFYQEALEVRNMPKSDPNKRLAYHFDNGPGRTCSPACHWVNIAEQLLKKNERDLAICAKVYCLLGFAVADGYSNAWYMKYKYNLLRPATYITENIDPSWEPLIETPPYPDYVSGSAVMGGVAPTVLVSVLEDRTFVDQTHLGSSITTPDGATFVLPERQFESITKCGEEMAESRVAAGVHFRRACKQGLEAGRCIGSTILGRLEFGY
jgi:hypothetical protein